jgi:nucleotide-binding universal stress UspA family protein
VAGVYASLPTGNEFQEENEQLAKTAPPDPAISVSRRFIVGSPAEEIVRCANDLKADMIVMGTHGRTGVVRILLGSVAEAILRHATCPVLTVKSPAPAATA